MRLITFRSSKGTSPGIILEGDRVLDLREAVPGLSGATSALDVILAGESGIAEVSRATKQTKNANTQALSGVELLAPIPLPRKNVFCVGRNYKEHIIEGARARGVEPSFPKVPEFFSKPPTTVIGPEAGIRRHAENTQQLDYEVELAIVIGKRVSNLSPERALTAIFGYTIVNDISARDAQFAHGQWFKGKSFDTFCPLGPCIVTADEFGNSSGHRISLKVNGETRQDSNTADLLFTVPQIIAALSAGLTLEPGDIIATGTPSGVALGMTPQKWLQVGDSVEAEIEGIGRLRNRVIG